jgi:RHH-type rel operon transcriptional repressor/antitoxin RelB
MLSVKLEPGTERRLAELARRTGRTRSYYAREMIEAHLGEMERRYLGEARKARSSKRRYCGAGQMTMKRSTVSICRLPGETGSRGKI